MRLRNYNPLDMGDAEIAALATGREELVGTILGIIEDNRQADRLRHVLVSAPRGFGKSFLLRLIGLQVAERWPDQTVVMVQLPEEQPNITAPHLLLKEILRVLRKEPAGSVRPEWYDDDRAAWEDARAALDHEIGARLLVAGVENFDTLVRGVFHGDESRQRLRHLIERAGGRLMLLATTASGNVEDAADTPLFQTFRPLDIEPWDEDYCIAFFNRRCALAGKPRLDARGEAKARALVQFIGGTPRLAMLIGEALIAHDALRAAETLNVIADDLTPYYKHRIESLGDRARLLLDALLRGGEPCSQTALAERVGAGSQNTIARAFAELQREHIVIGERATFRIVNGEPTTARRETLYRVADRVLAHYYRKRFLMASQGVSPLESIIDFLETFFTAEEKCTEARRLLDCHRLPDARVLLDLAGPTPDLKGWSGRRSLLQYAISFLEDLRPCFGAAVSSTFEQALTALVPERLKDARTLADAGLAIASGREEKLLWRLFLVFCDLGLGHDEAAEYQFGQTKSLTADWPEGQVAVLLAKASHYEDWRRDIESLANVTKALTTLSTCLTDPRWQSLALRNVAWNLGQLGRHPEAIDTAREAARLAAAAGDTSEQAEALDFAAWSLGQLDRHPEAIDTAREAARLAAAVGDTRKQAVALDLAAVSLHQLGRYREALDSARQGAELLTNDDNDEVWAWLLFAQARAAGALGDVDSVRTAFEQRLTLVLPESEDAPTALDLFDNLLAAVVRAGAWSALTVWIQRRASWPGALGARARFRLDACADALSELASTDRDGAIAAAASLLAALAPALAEEAAAREDHEDEATEDDASFTVLIRGILTEIIRTVTDPVVLRALAERVAETVPPDLSPSPTWFRAAALYHEGGRAPAALERIDPDLRTALLHILPAP